MIRGGRQATMMELERRAQQIKAVVRVSAALRADMKPESICAQVVQTIHSTLGFRAAVLNLIVPGNRHFIIAATAGISDAERQRLLNDPPPVDHILSVMKPEFQIGHSYFVSHEHKYLLEGAGGIMLLTPSGFGAPRTPNAWHPEDVFLVPLNSMRDGRIIGVISLDLPEDGKTPTYESVEVIELLANQAATALDTARLFQERDYERQALEYGLADLLAHLERMRQRDFSSQVQLRSTALNKVAGALNDVSQTLGNVLADVRDAGMVLQQQSSEMRNAATQLVNSAQRQAEQIRNVSETVEHTAYEMRQIVARAADSSAIAEEAEEISDEGRQAAELAGSGMNSVREITLQAANRIKRLGESSQEIGQIIQTVSEFARQTHLLALNAAIEAANAGEHGTGFAMVAREIRGLAQNSNDAAKQIHARISAIQNETNQVAVTIERATGQVVQLSELVSRSGASLHAVDAAIQRIVNVIGKVHQTADEQARAATAVSGTMNTIADITGATWESAEQMSASMNQLAAMASVLQSKIEEFRLAARLQSSITAKMTMPPAATPTAPMASTDPRTDPHSISGLRRGDMAAEATMPMPAVQFPPRTTTGPLPAMSSSSAPSIPIPSAPPAPTPNFDPAESDTVQMMSISIAPPGESGNTGSAESVPSPAPLSPWSNSALIPLRLSAIENAPASDSGASAETPTDSLPESDAQDAPPVADVASGSEDVSASGDSVAAPEPETAVETDGWTPTRSTFPSMPAIPAVSAVSATPTIPPEPTTNEATFADTGAQYATRPLPEFAASSPSLFAEVATGPMPVVNTVAATNGSDAGAAEVPGEKSTEGATDEGAAE